MGKFTLEFGPKSTARLDELAREKEVSRADIVRRALEVYSDLMSAKQDSATIVLRRKDGAEREIVSL